MSPSQEVQKLVERDQNPRKGQTDLSQLADLLVAEMEEKGYKSIPDMLREENKNPWTDEDREALYRAYYDEFIRATTRTEQYPRGIPIEELGTPKLNPHNPKVACWGDVSKDGINEHTFEEFVAHAIKHINYDIEATKKQRDQKVQTFRNLKDVLPDLDTTNRPYVGETPDYYTMEYYIELLSKSKEALEAGLRNPTLLHNAVENADSFKIDNRDIYEEKENASEELQSTDD